MKKLLLPTLILALLILAPVLSNAQNRIKDKKLDEPNSISNQIDQQNYKNELLDKNYSLSNRPFRNNQAIDSNLSQQLQNVLDDAILNYNIKGLSAAIQTFNDDIWVGAAGVSHDTISVKSDMLMGIGSITKNFIATIILQLYEEGSLNLTDSLHKWLPSFQNIDSTATIKQLLNHTSGIYNYLMYPGIDDTIQAYDPKIWTPEEILEKFVLEAYFPPGTNWEYSNTNYILLGLIIEEATGNSILDELHNRLTIPLGLNSTFLYPDEEYVGIRSHCWIPWNNTLLDVTEFENASWYSVYWTAGAILSTPEQLVNWQKGLYEGNLLNDTTLDLMKQPAPYSGGSYGLGTQIGLLNNELVYGHTGDVVYYSQLLYVPSESLSIAVISNTRFAPINTIWLDLYITYINVTGVDAKNMKEIKLKVGPNPFSTSTTIEYELKQPETIQFSIYNHLGQLIYQIEENQPQGMQKLIWYAEGYADGVYYYRLQVGDAIANGKMVKVK